MVKFKVTRAFGVWASTIVDADNKQEAEDKASFIPFDKLKIEHAEYEFVCLVDELIPTEVT